MNKWSKADLFNLIVLSTVCNKVNHTPGIIVTAVVCAVAVIIVCAGVCYHEKEQKRMGIQPVLRTAEDREREIEDDGTTTMEYIDSERGESSNP